MRGKLWLLLPSSISNLVQGMHLIWQWLHSWIDVRLLLPVEALLFLRGILKSLSGSQVQRDDGERNDGDDRKCGQKEAEEDDMRRRRVSIVLAMSRDVDCWGAMSVRRVRRRASLVAADAEVMGLVKPPYSYVYGDQNICCLLPRAWQRHAPC